MAHVMDLPNLLRRNGRFYDPIEDTTDYNEVIKFIEEQIEDIMKDEPEGLGSCHRYWALKKELLAQRGIEWKNPAECNPYILFD